LTLQYVKCDTATTVYIVHSVLFNRDQHWEPAYTVQHVTLGHSSLYTVELELPKSPSCGRLTHLRDWSFRPGKTQVWVRPAIGIHSSELPEPQTVPKWSFTAETDYSLNSELRRRDMGTFWKKRSPHGAQREAAKRSLPPNGDLRRWENAVSDGDDCFVFRVGRVTNAVLLSEWLPPPMETSRHLYFLPDHSPKHGPA
jgi:hypothetical protein